MLLEELQRQQEHGRRMMAALAEAGRKQTGAPAATARNRGATAHSGRGGYAGGGAATSEAHATSQRRRPASIARRGGRNLLIDGGATALGGSASAAVMSPVRAKTSHGGARDKGAQRRTLPQRRAPQPQRGQQQPQQQPQQPSAKGAEPGGGVGHGLAASASLPSVGRGGAASGPPLSPHPWTGEPPDRAGSPTAMVREGVAASLGASPATRSRLRWHPRHAPARDSPDQGQHRGKGLGLPAL